MTLQQLPPPSTDRFEFDQDIESGLRPPLFTRDVSHIVSLRSHSIAMEFHFRKIQDILLYLKNW